MTARTLVTGAGGNAGREVVRALVERGMDLRAADHAPDRTREVVGPDVEIAPFDFNDPTTWATALEGCTGVFLLRPPPISKVETTLNPFVDEARKAGIEQVVFLSVAGAEKNKVIPHAKVEAHLFASSAPYTILRPGFFAQNLQDAYRQDICEDDRIYVPAGAGRAAFVDLHDVADVAAAAFADPGNHENKAHTLTGPAPISFSDAARILTGALGRTIRYEPASVVGYVRHLRGRRLSWGQTAVQTILHVGLRHGQAAAVDPTLEQLLGRPGRTLETYINDNAHIWAREATS